MKHKKTMKHKKWFAVFATVVCTWLSCMAAPCDDVCYWDRTVAEFPVLPGETNDTDRLQRAIDASGGGVLFVPAGDYRISRTLQITNLCSVLMHKRARFVAVAPMEFVVRLNFAPYTRTFNSMDFGTFFKGGRIDGKGIASCMAVHGYVHLTLRDVCFHNGKMYGLRVKGEGKGGGAEMNASNLHFINTVSGNAGNVAVRVSGSDDNFTDCWTVDYTTGFDVDGGSNFFTRCHAWGGRVRAPAPGEMPEYLRGSVGFRVRGGSNTILRDCYSDTASIGYLVEGWEVRILGCCYFYNTNMIKLVKPENLDNFLVFSQPRGSMLVADGMIVKNRNMKSLKVYEGKGRARFRDMIYGGKGFAPGDARPGACEFVKEVARDVILLD